MMISLFNHGNMFHKIASQKSNYLIIEGLSYFHQMQIVMMSMMYMTFSHKTTGLIDINYTYLRRKKVFTTVSLSTLNGTGVVNNSIVRPSSCPLTKTTPRQYEDTNEVNMQKQKTHILCYLQKV